MFWPFRRKKAAIEPKVLIAFGTDFTEDYNNIELKKACHRAAQFWDDYDGRMPRPSRKWPNVVAAIKQLRELTGYGLKEAKAIVDQWVKDDD